MYKGPLRWIALLAGIAAIAAVFLMRGGRDPEADRWSKAPAELRAVLWPNAHPVAPFRMLTQQRQVFTEAQLQGRWSLVFFGYLSCPDVCPTTLLTLADLHRRLKAQGESVAQMQFVFISVDPARDTPERLAPYLAYFDPGFIGLSGEPAQLAALARSLGAVYAERVDERGLRSMEHSTSIVLVDPRGWVVGAFPAPHDPARMQQQFQQLTRIKYNPAAPSI
ncbi:MAG: SCO family protein [Steroidobacteraceae bacterium]